MKTLFALTTALALTAGGSWADTKIGMITTLSGGGAGLGIDVRDGFMLAISQSGRDDVEVVIEDDQRKPDIAVQLADKMIQSEKVDVMTGIIWSNLAMAVVPAATAQGKFYLSPNAGPSQLAGAGCHENYYVVSWQNDAYAEAAGKWAKDNGFVNAIVMAPNYPAGKDTIAGFKRLFEGEIAAEIYTKLGQTDYAAEIAQIKAADACDRRGDEIDHERAAEICRHQLAVPDFGQFKVRREPENHRRQRKVEHEFGEPGCGGFGEKPRAPRAVSQADDEEKGECLQEYIDHGIGVAWDLGVSNWMWGANSRKSALGTLLVF